MLLSVGDVLQAVSLVITLTELFLHIQERRNPVGNIKRSQPRLHCHEV